MTERSDPIVIAASVRTPLGRFQGELSSVPAPRIGSAVIKAAVERAGVDPGRISEVLMGCVPAGRSGPGTGAPSCARRRRSRRHRCHHREQGLRLRHEKRHART